MERYSTCGSFQRGRGITISPTIVGTGANGIVFDAGERLVAKIQPVKRITVREFASEVNASLEMGELGLAPRVHSFALIRHFDVGAATQAPATSDSTFCQLGEIDQKYVSVLVLARMDGTLQTQPLSSVRQYRPSLLQLMRRLAAQPQQTWLPLDINAFNILVRKAERTVVFSDFGADWMFGLPPLTDTPTRYAILLFMTMACLTAPLTRALSLELEFAEVPIAVRARAIGLLQQSKQAMQVIQHYRRRVVRKLMGEARRAEAD